MRTRSHIHSAYYKRSTVRHAHGNADRPRRRPNARTRMEAATCLGPLEPGEYQTSTFEPQLNYTVPAGWTNFEDLPGNFWLFLQEDSQDGALGGSYLGIYQNVHAAAINCARRLAEGRWHHPRRSRRLVPVGARTRSSPSPSWLRSADSPASRSTCPSNPTLPTCRYGPYAGIPLIMGGGVGKLHHVLLKELNVRLVILGWEDGNVTLEITNVKKQHSAKEFRSMLQPIINSLAVKA